VPVSRAFWKGYLKLSFVSCPVALYPATSGAERISFRQVNRRTGHRLRHKLIDSVTGEAVHPANKARGYEVAEDEFVLIDDRDLERARSARPPPGAVKLVEPLRSESLSPMPAMGHEPDLIEAAAEAEEEEEDIAPIDRPQNTRTIEIKRFLPAGQIDRALF
jgi:DNA end-binding protein Ku